MANSYSREIGTMTSLNYRQIRTNIDRSSRPEAMTEIIAQASGQERVL